jgi:predicted phosphodiesterase
VRFGLIGDVHAEDERLGVALATLTKAKVDRILCVGNLVDGHGNVDNVCALLARHRVTTVRGNHDRWIRADEKRTRPNAHQMTSLAIESIEMIKTLPRTLVIDLPGGKLLLCHGVGEDDTQGVRPDDRGDAISQNAELLKILFDPSITLMVCGHTHIPMLRRFERGPGQPPLIVVNAGTLARQHKPGFVILDVVARRVDFITLADDLSVIPTSRAVF